MDASKLTDVPETMLITLWAKAEETQREDALLHDEKAVEMLDKIEYDFSKFRNAKLSQAGCSIRASLIDKEAKKFFSEYPDAVAIQLGAGLDARYERLQRPTITHWYDLDMEEPIALRKQLLSESERNTYIATSMFDYSWTEKVNAYGKPVLIILEGVLMYFAPEEVKAFFNELCRLLDNATVIFDMLCFDLVGKSKHHDTLSKMGSKVEFKWSLLDSKEMETWNPKIHLVKEYYMSKYDEGHYPFIYRLLYKIPYFSRHMDQRVVVLNISK